MIRSGAGHSNDAEGMRAVDAALSEALANLSGSVADVVFLFATYHHMGDAAAMVDVAIDRAGTDVVVGCSAMGVLTDARENDREPGVAVLALAGDQLSVVPIVAEGDEEDNFVGERVLPYSDEAGLLVLMPGVTSNPVVLIDQVAEMVGNVPIVGGVASGNPWAQESPRTLQWCGNWIGENGIAGVLLTGVKVATGV
ncbi:MAG: FIST N-terminal domain-containing protein, partial [Candidatus Latescibacteria bacterium]|nr:FIST N-terminal domain-containing protein [Candidatus Latescibacterota bacterium]